MVVIVYQWLFLILNWEMVEIVILFYAYITIKIKFMSTNTNLKKCPHFLSGVRN